MPLVFPLSPAEWMDRLAVEDVVFDTDEAMEVSETAGGEAMKKRLGPTLWSGRVDMMALRYDCGAGRAAMLAVLRAPGASFLVYNKRKQFPAEDPDGVKLGAATPTLTSINATGEATIDGLPALYVLTAGDYIGWTYGTNPVRYALHQVVLDATAQGRTGTNPGRVSGLILHPMPRAGWTAGAAVTLIRPVCKAIIRESSRATFGRVAMAGLSFDWQQTLR